MQKKIRKKINNIYQFLVWKFCKEPEKVNWPKEIVIGKSLIKDYGEELFKQLSFDIEIESLAQFRSKKFKAFLAKQRKLLDLDFRKDPVIIKEEKIGEDKKITRKPKTLIDFLKDGSEKENKTTG
jgi:hypothetical protein